MQLAKRGLLFPGHEADLMEFDKNFGILASMRGGRFLRNELSL